MPKVKLGYINEFKYVDIKSISGILCHVESKRPYFKLYDKDIETYIVAPDIPEVRQYLIDKFGDLSQYGY